MYNNSFNNPIHHTIYKHHNMQHEVVLGLIDIISEQPHTTFDPYYNSRGINNLSSTSLSIDQLTIWSGIYKQSTAIRLSLLLKLQEEKQGIPIMILLDYQYTDSCNMA